MNEIERPMQDTLDELKRAMLSYPPMQSSHEGFAILLEEVHELWDQVRQKQGSRDIERMRAEAVQVAAMALRFVHDVCDCYRGQR